MKKTNYFNPAEAAKTIKNEYVGYITTSYNFRDQNIQQIFKDRVNNFVSNGPFIEIKDSFRSGKCIEELIKEGALSPLFMELEKRDNPSIPIDRPLYLHQEKAIRKIVAGDNIVVSTGTGSGKTNCFIIPVINELLREKEQGTLCNGVRAIFIYPMNALANDQVKGLRELLMDYPDITFGVYNGGTENKEKDAIALYELMASNEKEPKLRKRLPNEELSRDEMKKKPPHILFTNYAMLEHMLLRPKDDVIFSNSNFKYIILDEAHVYSGATGIETAFLMSRLKGRIAGTKSPQFILTSATLGDGTKYSNELVIKFADALTGSKFKIDNIIIADRENSQKSNNQRNYPTRLFTDLAANVKPISNILQEYNIDVDTKLQRAEILYDIISSSYLYNRLRTLGQLVDFETITKKLEITAEVAVAFIHLCAAAIKNKKALIDVRYHYFLRALDGCYMAPHYPESLTMIRKSKYQIHYGNSVQMFEIAICDDCGEMTLVGKLEKLGQKTMLLQGNKFDTLDYFQIIANNDTDESEDETEYRLCTSCGAIVDIEETHNNWCECDNHQPIKIRKVKKCLICNGEIRRVNLGYEAATGVVATSLFEQIPEYITEVVDKQDDDIDNDNPFFSTNQIQTRKVSTGNQFLIFSDSRQGAAKFACYLNDSYKEFLRRRSIWNLATTEESIYPDGIPVKDFIERLRNNYSATKMFRQDNSDGAQRESTRSEDIRNAWVGVLNEMCNSSRATSLVSLGKISFKYKGINNQTVLGVSQKYQIKTEDVYNLINYLAFEIVLKGAIETDSPNDINEEDRKYLFFTSYQKDISKNKESKEDIKPHFMPTEKVSSSGEKTYYKSNVLSITKRALKLEDDKEVVKFLDSFWSFLTDSRNDYKLESKNGKRYTISAKHFDILLGKSAKLWICEKCKKVTQFNIGGKCIRTNCTGNLRKLNTQAFYEDNHYAQLYQTKKDSPLFVKEHTAQLSKKNALDYQQQFVRKEINALSCSTTFEMGVDVGGLETVFLRNIPPLPSNYAQRVGRAGRSINAAAFALTYARLASHDFTFFDNPSEMINGKIYPPHLILENEKILKRHIYAIAFALFLKKNPDQYYGNDAEKFINSKGYEQFFEWLIYEPEELKQIISKSIANLDEKLSKKYVTSFDWVEEFCGENGLLSRSIKEFENNIEYLNKELAKARRSADDYATMLLTKKLNHYKKNNLIDFLVRRNILPKYGFPVDTVEMSQNIASSDYRTLNLNRDLSVAIAEYAPSAQVVADGRLYTSRYIKKTIVNKKESYDFDYGYFAKCSECDNENYSNIPISSDGIECMVCGNKLKPYDFRKSIEPRGGFITEEQVGPVPMSSQDKKYKTEAIYIGNREASCINKYTYTYNGIEIEVESTTNDSLIVKSLDEFYVCSYCGYAIAEDEDSKLNKYEDYKKGGRIQSIKRTSEEHKNPFGKGNCKNKTLYRNTLHHEFKTDVAKLSFKCSTSDYATMLSVMYAILNSFSNHLNIEHRDIKACLTYKKSGGMIKHQIIIYDSVPGGAGHSRQLVTQEGEILFAVIKRAIALLESCSCSPSCYRCLRSYENQRVHEIINREKALEFLRKFIDEK